ncbi:HEPN domain-containing protein [Celeribacter sp.]|uniref:HEPN domain-containing protein n=1 Tax=Celeribacter sp. TaxID=1890673 RepID=UPI003A946B64
MVSEAMERFNDAISTFEHAIQRTQHMVALFDALTALRPGDPANDDALRSSYILAVSSFDFFAHELAAIEAKHRFKNAIDTRNINLPMEVMTITDENERLAVAESQVRQSNSFKAFVDPAKLAELLSCYCTKPWDKICERLNEGAIEQDQRTVDELKGRLKSIWKRRNQIAHEADVNPTLSGIGLWPIDKVDTELTITFMSKVGLQLPHVISQELSAGGDQ